MWKAKSMLTRFPQLNIKMNFVEETLIVKIHATFVEEFWPEFHARGRFMKYSMSALGRLKGNPCLNGLNLFSFSLGLG